MLKEIETKTKWISDRLIQYVDIVFGVVVGQSLIRNKDLLSNPLSFPFASLALFIVLSTVTLSWMGYHKSMYKYPYKAERISKKRLRPFTDFIIVITYTYFLFTVESYKIDVVNIDLFSFVICYVLFFGLYLLDGFIRIWEYHDVNASKISQLRNFFISYLVLLGLYIAFQKYNLLNVVYLNYGVMLACAGIYLNYRLAREPYHSETIFTIVVDVDGVLADQVTPVLENINEKFGSNYKKSDIVLWDQPLPIANTNIKIEVTAQSEGETKSGR